MVVGYHHFWKATCATLATAKVISWSAAFFTVVRAEEVGKRTKSDNEGADVPTCPAQRWRKKLFETDLLAVIDISEAPTDVGPSQHGVWCISASRPN